MSKPEPELELLRRGDLLHLTRLDVATQRAAMRTALRERVAMFTRNDSADPALALIDALAACLDVMGFYHDRIITESKLGSAQRLESVARLGAAIGYRPLPPIAATAKQFFLAARAGTVTAGTQVAGDAVFATTRALDIAPSVNRMELSPVITLHTGAQRAVIERLDEAAARPSLAALQDIAAEQAGTPTTLPSDELRRGMIAMVNSDHGLELCTVAASRARAFAFQRALLRSYDDGTTVARTTRVRHLRYAQPLDDSLVVFEVSELPILHLPAPAELDIVNQKQSSLEIFVFDQPPGSPEDWDRTAAWTEVLDFSASKASDLHYRTFVDDRLTTYIILRRKLGFRTLIDDERLGRVYARYTPAVGQVIERPSAPSADPWNLGAVTLRLDGDYLTTSLVRPKLGGVAGLHNEARWAVTKDDMALDPGAQIAILGGASGALYVRTLFDVGERYLAWGKEFAGERQPADPANEHDAIDEFFDPEKAKIAPLADVASGQLYPLWEAYYKQATEPDTHWVKGPVPGTEIPPETATGITSAQLSDDIEQIIYLHKGSTFLLLEGSPSKGTANALNGSHVKAGDYLLVGRRLTRAFQHRKPRPPAGGGPADAPKAARLNEAASTTDDDTQWFDTSKPWLTAEVVQAIEVQGDLVRLKDPIAQDYYQDRQVSAPTNVLTEVVVVPRVASVYYGDLFSQIVQLTSKRTFITNSSLTSIYIEVALDTAIDNAADLRGRLALSGAFSDVFFAVEGQVSDAVATSWLFPLTLVGRGLGASQLGGIARVRIGGQESAVVEGPTSAGADVALATGSATDTIAARDNPDALALVMTDGAISWDVEFTQPGPLPAGNFRMLARPGWFFEVADLDARQDLLLGGGSLFFWDHDSELGPFAFDWEHSSTQLAATLLLKDIGPNDPRPVPEVALAAVAIPRDRTFDVASLTWTADFRLPSGLFDNATHWMSSVHDGTLEIETAGTPRDHAFKVSAAGELELHGVPVARPAPRAPLDPLDGATAAWALPSVASVALTPSLVTAIWRFGVGDDALTALGASWHGPLAAIGPRKILGATTLGGAAGSFVLQADLVGDATHDLRGSRGAIHALRPEAALTVTALDIWEWTGAAPFTPSTPAEPAAFAFDETGVVHASFWSDGNTLRLIPDAAFVDRTIVAQLIGYHPDPVENVTATFADPTTTIEFDLPATWPMTSASVEQQPAQAFLGTLAQGEEIVSLLAGPISVADGKGTFKVTGDLRGRWSAIRLALHGPAHGTVTRKHALRIMQPAWSGWVPRPQLGLFVTPDLISSDPISDLASSARFLPVHGTSRSDDFWFVRTSGSFPQLDQQSVYLSPYSTDNVAAVAATALDLNPLPAGEAVLGFVGIRDAHGPSRAHRLPAGSVTRQGRVELPEAAPDVFPDGIAGTSARLAYDFAADVSAPSTGLALSLTPATGGTNRAVFHTETLQDAVRAPAAFDGQALRVEIDPRDVFTPSGDPAGSPPRSKVSLGYGWESLPASSVVRGPLIELAPPAGSSLALEAGDELTFFDATGVQRVAAITGVTLSGAYEVDLQEAPARVHLRALRTQLHSFDIDVSFDKPAGPHEPWLLTTGSGTVSNGSIADTLLFHGGARTDANRIRFRLSDRGLLESIAHTPAVRYYTNQATQLHQGLYDGSLAERSGTNNFLKSTAPDEIGVLLASANAPSFPVGVGPGPQVLIASRSRPEPLAPGDGYFVSGTGTRELKTVAIPVLSQSIVFPSGDFIPVTGTLEDRDDKIIRNALRVWLLAKPSPAQGLEGAELEQAESRLVTYDPRLTKIVEMLDAAVSWNTICDTLAVENIAGLRKDDPDVRLYSFNKALGGAFTLNFLLIGAALEDPDPNQTQPSPRKVKVYVEYSADRLPENAPDSEVRIYQFETPLRRLEPTTQLVVIDKGELKPDDYLFLHAAQQPIIQWTRVASVTGVVIAVDPPLPFAIDRFRSYALRGFAKPARPTALDKDYYSQAKDADLSNAADPTSPLPLVLADRLVVDPDAGKELLAAIIPGDRLLIWDEGHRVAWHHHRVQAGGDAGWQDWPDFQHEAVVKQVDPATGLLVLSEPLPERFQVAFELHPDPQTQPPPYTLQPRWYTDATTPASEQKLALRVLPHYRAPFQGKRRMITLGSGDKSRRFARFTSELDPDPGLATVPLSDPAVPVAEQRFFASNIEVLARDPRSGEWSRWTQLADINGAAKKDRAFVLGVDASRIGQGTAVPFSASFGDGVHGQVLPTGTRNVFARATAIGGRLAHVRRRRALRILDAQANQPVPVEVPPAANAASRNLRLFLETGAPEPGSVAGGRTTWHSTIAIETAGGRIWQERSLEQILAGWDGFLVEGERPGVVRVSFFTPEPIALDLGSTHAWELPDARQWALDAAFYAELASQDLTRTTGATRVQLLETDSLGRGSLLALSQGGVGKLADRSAGETEILELDAVDPDTWSATLSLPLERTYAIDQAFLRGNIVEIVQGKTERVVLGSGDGASLDMRLAVSTRAPMLHVLRGQTDPVPAIRVLVDDAPWSRVTDLESSGPRDRVYRVDIDARGRPFVVFGDGVRGAVPGAGTSNIVAIVQTGDGGAGNVAIDTVTKLLDGNLAVKSTTNVTEGTGGRPADQASDAREALLRKSLGVDRIISLEDVSQVALEVGEVLHARVDPTAPAGALRLVVALRGRRALTETIRKGVADRVDDLLPATAGVTVTVDAAKEVPVYLVVKITTDPAFDQSAVLSALRLAFGTARGGFFAEDNCPIAQPLRAGDVYEAVYAVSGVSSAQVVWMSTARPPPSPSGQVPDDTVDPGPEGVLRCDSDPVNDPDGDRGTIVFSPTSGGAS